MIALGEGKTYAKNELDLLCPLATIHCPIQTEEQTDGRPDDDYSLDRQYL